MIKIILITFFISFSLRADYSISDHILSFDTYLEAKNYLNEENIKTRKNFKSYFNDLSKKKKKRLLEASEAMEGYLPEYYLRSILYWKIIKNKKVATKKILEWLMVHNLMLLKKNYLLTQDEKYLQDIKDLTSLSDFDLNNLIYNYFELIEEKASILSELDRDGFIEALARTPLLSKVVKLDHNLLNDPMGIIENNEVKYISQNDKSLSRIRWFIDNTINGEEDDELLKKLISEHPNLKDDKVLIETFKLIDEAKSNLLLNVCCISDILGYVFASKIEQKLKTILQNNQEFKIYLNTTTTHPLIKYKNIDSIENVFKKIKEEFPNNFDYSYDLISKLPSISDDNSKIVVADMNTTDVKAIITTKPLSDFYGGFNYDSAVMIKGPAAQLSAYRYFRELSQYAEGDVINSFIPDGSLSFSLGGKMLSLHQSGTLINNSLGAVLDIIASAKESIQIDSHYFYDPNIVDTLIKVKIKNPELNVKVLLDSNLYMNMNGFPNTTYLHELFSYGIQAKSRNTIAIPIEGEKSVYQINNRNLILVDGKSMLVTSATFRPFSFVDSSIEFGVSVFDESVVSELSSQFDSDWQDTNKTLDLNINEFSAQFGDKKLSKDLSSLINHLMGFFLRQRH